MTLSLEKSCAPYVQSMAQLYRKITLPRFDWTCARDRRRWPTFSAGQRLLNAVRMMEELLPVLRHGAQELSMLPR
jgi:hypothetical protein